MNDPGNSFNQNASAAYAYNGQQGNLLTRISTRENFGGPECGAYRRPAASA